MRPSLALAAILLAAAAPPKAEAATFGPSLTGIANPATTIDFSGQTPDAVIGSSYAGQGVTFIGLYGSTRFSFTGISSPSATNFKSDGSMITPVFEFDFSTPVSALSFYLVTDEVGTTITSYLAGNLVEILTTTSSYSNDGNDYYGFTATDIDRVVFSVPGDNAALIDNVSFNPVTAVTAVPEPVSIALLGTGLLATAIRRRPRR